MLTNIFRILAHKLEDFTLGTVKKDESMNEWMNQWNAAKVGYKNESWLGGEGHRKRGMYESFLGWYLLTLSSKVMIIEQVLSKLKDW